MDELLNAEFKEAFDEFDKVKEHAKKPPLYLFFFSFFPIFSAKKERKNILLMPFEFRKPSFIKNLWV